MFHKFITDSHRKHFVKHLYGNFHDFLVPQASPRPPLALQRQTASRKLSEIFFICSKETFAGRLEGVFNE